MSTGIEGEMSAQQEWGKVKKAHEKGQRTFSRYSIAMARAYIEELEKQVAAWSTMPVQSSPPVIISHASTVQFPCVRCGIQAHAICTEGGAEVYRCAICNTIAAVV